MQLHRLKSGLLKISFDFEHSEHIFDPLLVDGNPLSLSLNTKRSLVYASHRTSSGTFILRKQLKRLISAFISRYY